MMMMSGLTMMGTTTAMVKPWKGRSMNSKKDLATADTSGDAIEDRDPTNHRRTPSPAMTNTTGDLVAVTKSRLPMLSLMLIIMSLRLRRRENIRRERLPKRVIRRRKEVSLTTKKMRRKIRTSETTHIFPGTSTAGTTQMITTRPSCMLRMRSTNSTSTTAATLTIEWTSIDIANKSQQLTHDMYLRRERKI